MESLRMTAGHTCSEAELSLHKRDMCKVELILHSPRNSYQLRPHQSKPGYGRCYISRKGVKTGIDRGFSRLYKSKLWELDPQKITPDHNKTISWWYRY